MNQSDHTGDATHSHRWTSLELVKGTYTTDDSPSDIAEIRLDKVVPLKVNKIKAHLSVSYNFFRWQSWNGPCKLFGFLDAHSQVDLDMCFIKSQLQPIN